MVSLVNETLCKHAGGILAFWPLYPSIVHYITTHMLKVKAGNYRALLSSLHAFPSEIAPEYHGPRHTLLLYCFQAYGIVLFRSATHPTIHAPRYKQTVRTKEGQDPLNSRTMPLWYMNRSKLAGKKEVPGGGVS